MIEQTLPAQDEDLATAPPLFTALGNGPEARLMEAYAALAQGQVRRATQLAAELVQAHPDFALAQMLHGDLLAGRAGKPSAFGVPAKNPRDSASAELKLIQEQAMRRLAALRERPPAGHVPREFVNLPAHVRYAVAVDTERSRLYLFVNTTDGLVLERDFYASLGKQGIAKQVEGDARTPLGVYWITNALPSHMLAERFGRAALGLNYPNAVDRAKGRTGTGLFVHGVPPKMYSHGLWATDGCVALANEDVQLLLERLVVGDSPVVIARQLDWVPAAAAKKAADDFRPAYAAWDEARRKGDAAGLQRWYETSAVVPRAAALGPAPRGDVSFVAWYGEVAPMMVVTAREEPRARGIAAASYRQYWAQHEGQWRIVFDGSANGPNR